MAAHCIPLRLPRCLYNDFCAWQSAKHASAMVVPIVHVPTPAAPAMLEPETKTTRRATATRPVSAKTRGRTEMKMSETSRLPAKQLPMRVYTNFDHGRFEAVVYWVDNPDGGKSVENPNNPGKQMRSYSFIRITQTPPDKKDYLGRLFSSVSKSVNFIQGNTESGWDAWKDCETKQKISVFRREKWGSGFLPHPGATTQHRDFLASHCWHRAKCKFYHSADVRDEMDRNWTLDSMYEFFEQFMPKTILSISATPEKSTKKRALSSPSGHTTAKKKKKKSNKLRNVS